MDTIEELQDKICKFVQERDWEQFHSPKNLSMAIATEAGELMEHFQWLNNNESKKIEGEGKIEEIEQEIADVLIYVLRFCDQMDIDPKEAVEKKLELNREKYPVDQSKGNSKKYTEFKNE